MKFNFWMERRRLILSTLFETIILLVFFILPIINGTFMNQSILILALASGSILGFIKSAYGLYEIDSTSIVTGLLFGKTISLKKVTEVLYDKNSIVICYEGPVRQRIFKISIFLLESNLEKARMFLKTVVERINRDSIISQDILDFAANKKRTINRED